MLSGYVDLYIAELTQALSSLKRESVWAVISELMTAWHTHHQVFLIGNGGSASTASHMANDLNKIVVPGQPRFRAISLADNVALMTAWANDAAYERIFSEQLQNFCQRDDVVIAISCSGNSPNILRGVETARQLGAHLIGFTGGPGGRLESKVDICVPVPANFIGQQEDVHLALDHMITSTLRQCIEHISRQISIPPKALILAAGEGTRLRPLTLSRPKPMLPICGKPLLEHTLNWLHRHGIREAAINLNYHPEVITDYFGNGASQQIEITYSYEDPILGTAGAARKLSGYLADGAFVVIYGDVLTNLDLGAILKYHYHKAALDPAIGATLSLYHVSNPTEVGLVGLDGQGRVTRFVEKPPAEQVFTDLANAGVLVVEPSVLSLIPAGTFYDFGHHLLPQLLELNIPVYGWVVPHSSYLKDIGSPEKYNQAQVEWPLLCVDENR